MSFRTLAGLAAFTGAAALRSSSSPEFQTAPIVEVEGGKIKGYHDKGFDVFKSVPYVEPPVRFDAATPKKPWAPETLVAREFGPACVGASTGAEESEDCLTLNIWRPQSKATDLPVIVHIHSGLNQRGSGQDTLRQGDLVVQSEKYPVIYVTLNYRLGIFGWLEGVPGSPWTSNLGFRDQQAALEWVSRNIAFFGGHPSRVTLQAEGDMASVVQAHMVSPSSGALFQRVALHSPTIDRWSRNVNLDRSMFMVSKLGCLKSAVWTEVLDCLRSLPAKNLSEADWSMQGISENPGSPSWTKNFGAMVEFSRGRSSAQMQSYEGWHYTIDKNMIPGEPMQMIAQGNWNKVPVLITLNRNESMGVFPASGTLSYALISALSNTLKEGDLDNKRREYNNTLLKSGIFVTNTTELFHMMFTDKLWTCEARFLADFISRGGGTAYLSMFMHAPKYDPAGANKSEACVEGATCGSANMLYLLPQGRDVGIHGEGMEEELSLSRKYSEDFLGFVSGERGPWEPYTNTGKAMTLYETTGPRAEQGFRSSQCDVLDTSFASSMPFFWQTEGLGHFIQEYIQKPMEAHDAVIVDEYKRVNQMNEKEAEISLHRESGPRKRPRGKTVSST